ncbi:hypothetical protein PENTCL1PPCAC_23867, partial [Pristionchus entomophagus]
FYGNFAEKDKDEVEIKDIVFEEFLDLLRLIYLGPAEITDRNVLHILKLGDRFQIERVVDLSVKYLTQSKGFDAANKLLIADQYRLVSLKDHCLQSFTTLSDLMYHLNPECFSNFSSEMKNAIYDRMFKIQFPAT